MQRFVLLLFNIFIDSSQNAQLADQGLKIKYYFAESTASPINIQFHMAETAVSPIF
jgi:hypothetical protein